MKRKPRSLLTVFLALCLSASAQRHAAEQTAFTAEESPRYTVPLPDEAWKILQHDERVADGLAAENLKPEQLPRNWFSAARVHLHTRTEDDFVVEAELPLAGANIVTFWVFAPIKGHLQLMFQVGAHDLSILPARYRGYAVIEASAENCCTISYGRFHFDGKRYVQYKDWSEDIGK